MLDTTMHKSMKKTQQNQQQTEKQIMCETPLCVSKHKQRKLRHEPSYKQLDVKRNRTSSSCGNRSCTMVVVSLRKRSGVNKLIWIRQCHIHIFAHYENHTHLYIRSTKLCYQINHRWKIPTYRYIEVELLRPNHKFDSSGTSVFTFMQEVTIPSSVLPST